MKARKKRKEKQKSVGFFFEVIERVSLTSRHMANKPQTLKPNPPTRAMVIPESTKNLRACLRCHILKTREQFIQEGCSNCVFFDAETNAREREVIVDKYTTASFKGVVAMITPGNGWVSRWQEIPGLSCFLAVSSFFSFHDVCGLFFFIGTLHNRQVPARCICTLCERKDH